MIKQNTKSHNRNLKASTWKHGLEGVLAFFQTSFKNLRFPCILKVQLHFGMQDSLKLAFGGL